MSRLVLDTNALIQILPRKSVYRPVWNSFLDGSNILCVSNEIIEEYAEILSARVGKEITNLVLNGIITRPTTVFITPYYHYHFIEADPDDDKFVDCAIAAGAKFIVTEDRHYNVLKRIDFPKVDIIGLDDCLAWLQKGKP